MKAVLGTFRVQRRPNQLSSMLGGLPRSQSQAIAPSLETALDDNDASASELGAKLIAQRQVAHVAFATALADAGDRAAVLHHRRHPAVAALE